MATELIGVIFLILLVILIMLGLPVGLTLLLIGFAGFALIEGLNSSLIQLGINIYNVSVDYTLSVLPLFILMGMFISYSGLGQSLFKVVDNWVGHVRGGLAMASIGASAMFSAISGSAMSTAATVGRVALPEMRRFQYDMGMGGASIAAGGTLGILIPPSVGMIIYGVLTLQPIGPLFIAGLVPGIILAILFMITIYIQVRLNPKLAPVTRNRSIPFKEKIRSSLEVWPILFLFLLVIGGIYMGWFTPTEAASIGAFGALVITLLTRRMTWQRFVDSLEETIRLTAAIFIILVGAKLFGNFLAVTRIPTELATYLAGLEVSRYVILIGILLIFLILGCFMEGIAILVLVLPVVYPVIVALNFDPIWFAAVIIVVQNMGLLTPPLGMNVYVVHGVDRSIPLHTIFKGVTPMLLAMAVLLVLLIIFPDIATFLLRFM